MGYRQAYGSSASSGAWLLMCTGNPDWIAAEIHAPGREEPQFVSLEPEGDCVHCSAPRLGRRATLVIRGERTGRSTP